MSKLTDREVQIVGFLADGLNVKQISVQIGMSEAHTKRVLHDVRNKTGMDTTVAAVAWCLRNRLIE